MTSLPKCRVCTCSLDAEAECYDMRKLPKLAHKFVTCTDLSFSEEERLPSELCQGCHDQLERLYAFRARCIAADTKWRMEILAFCEDMESTEDNEQLKSTDEITELGTNAPEAAAITELQPTPEEALVAAENITQIPTDNPEIISEEVSLKLKYSISIHSFNQGYKLVLNRFAWVFFGNPIWIMNRSFEIMNSGNFSQFSLNKT